MKDEIDNLEQQLRSLDVNDPEATRKIDDLLDAAEGAVSGDDPQKLIGMIADLRRFSDQLHYAKGQAYALLYEGLSCCFFAEHAKGLKTVDESQHMFEDIGDEFGVAKSIQLRANLLRSIGSFDQALSGLYTSLEFFRREKHAFWEAVTLYDLGLLYHEIGDYEKAFENHEASLQAVKNHPARWLEARALNGVGRALDQMGKQREALDYHHRSLTIFREIQHPMGEARALDDIGIIYYELGDHELALPFHNKSLAIRRSIGQRRAQSTSLLNIARVQLRQGEADPAMATLGDALAIAEETNSQPQVYAAHQLLSEAYELKGDHAQALSHYKAFQQTRERVFNDQAGDKIRKLEIAFEVEKAEKEAEIARLKNVELREKNERLERLLKELRETQSQLVQSEKLAILGKLVAGLVHEMNSPLGASNSAIDVSERCLNKLSQLPGGAPGRELTALLQHLRENHRITRDANDRLSRILQSMKSFSRLDEGVRQQVDVHHGLESTLALLEHEWKDRIEIVRDYGDVPTIDCCPGEMNQVFMNLFSNAIESIDGRGTINVRTSFHDGRIRIEIADTGSGIPAERLDNLFDPDFTRKGSRVKAGLGLLVSLNIVRKHGGTIDVKSVVGRGSRFTIILPLEESASEPEQASA
jgi:signal transduction histidine kinase